MSLSFEDLARLKVEEMRAEAEKDRLALGCARGAGQVPAVRTRSGCLS